MIRTGGGLVWKAFSSSAVRCLSSAPPPKPFYYQEILEHDKKIEIPYKKLTGMILVFSV
jgi:hypothetical protein